MEFKCTFGPYPGHTLGHDHKPEMNEAFNLTDLVGYAAMFTVLLSFMMKNFRKLRMVNSLGAILFVIYGFMLQISWPIVITNLAIVGVNGYYLFLRKN